MKKFISKIFPKKSRPTEGGTFFNTIATVIGFNPNTILIYEEAFTHRSTNKQDAKGFPFNYERLEFLGDSMLGAVIAAHLYKEVPHADEGYLTKMRSKIVSREHLNELGKELKLIDLVKSNVSKSHFGENIHGNLFEALVGAIFLDKGYTGCQDFINRRVIIPYVDIARLEGKITSYKSLLIEWCQKEKKLIHFDVFEDIANDSQKHFGVKLSIDSKVVAKARATSKKKAEETAAKRAYFLLQGKINAGK